MFGSLQEKEDAMLYMLISLLACLVGAISGLGGGMIIKPILDLASDFSVSTISVLSSFTVFTMALASLAKYLYDDAKIEIRLGILISLGAVVGGSVGNDLFAFLLHHWENPELVTLLQNVILMLLLLGVLRYMNHVQGKRSHTLTNPMAIVGTGIGLGTLASFIGIGGGPINMVVLTLLFSMGTKEATVNSLLLIFFSQGGKLTTILLTNGFSDHDLTALWFMIPAAILGGLVGAWFHKKLTAKQVLMVFNGTIVSIVGISLLNSIQILFTLW